MDITHIFVDGWAPGGFWIPRGPWKLTSSWVSNGAMIYKIDGTYTTEYGVAKTMNRFPCPEYGIFQNYSEAEDLSDELNLKMGITLHESVLWKQAMIKRMSA